MLRVLCHRSYVLGMERCAMRTSEEEGVKVKGPCGNCEDEEVCEQHPNGWPHDDCPGPGMPCPICSPLRHPDDLVWIPARVFKKYPNNEIDAVILADGFEEGYAIICFGQPQYRL